MNRIDENLKDSIEYGAFDKDSWLKNHTLSQDQVRQLILNKYKRAVKDQEKLDKLRGLISFTD